MKRASEGGLLQLWGPGPPGAAAGRAAADSGWLWAPLGGSGDAHCQNRLGHCWTPEDQEHKSDMQKQTAELPMEHLLPEHWELLEIIARRCRPAGLPWEG